jgi:hypothetical protein
LAGSDGLAGVAGRPACDIPALPAIAPTMSHFAHFESLASLTGQWSGMAPDGQTLRVTYSLHANNSVLLEHWQLRSTDALTIYHLDDGQMMATHYCPLCNQPRLNLMEVQGTKFCFACVSVTNLKSAAAEHQHAFEIMLVDQTHFWRSESYIADGVVTTEAVTYVRE